MLYKKTAAAASAAEATAVAAAAAAAAAAAVAAAALALTQIPGIDMQARVSNHICFCRSLTPQGHSGEA